MNRTTARRHNRPATTQTINLGQINISGLSRTSATSLDHFIAAMDLSIVAVQETGLSEENIDEISRSKQYDFLGKAAKNNCRGVALIISSSFKANRVPCLEEDDLDIIWAVMNIDNLNVLVCSLYCPPSTGNSQTLTLQRLLENITAAENFRVKHNLDSMVALGDFNSRSMQWGDTKTNARGNILQGFIEDSEITLFTPGDRTFVCSGDGGSVIDLMLMSGQIIQHVSNYWVERRMDLGTGAPVRGHFPVIASLSLKQQSKQRKHYLDFRKTDWTLWKDQCEQYLIGKLSSGVSVENGKEILAAVEESIKFANHVIPKKIVSPHSKPFWNQKLTDLAHEVQELGMKVHRYASPTNVHLLRVAKEDFKDALLHEKNEWIRDKLTDVSAADANLFWSSYKRLFGDKKSCHIGNLLQNDHLYSTEEDKEELLFNTFFNSDGLGNPDYDSSFAEVISDEYSHLFQSNAESASTPREESPLNADITSFELDLAIHELKTEGKCSDADAMNPAILKHLGTVAKQSLQKVFNWCMKTGNWPWTHSEVCFIRKPDKSSYMDPGSYRPITISSYIGKLLEKVLEKRLRKFYDLPDILDETQEGFCPNRSTSRYLYKLVSKLNEAKRKKLQAVILFIDFSKAFDSVWVKGLIVKLHRSGVSGNFLQLLNSFLSHRSISIKLNGRTFKTRLCSIIGLPQGSVLAPLLFILFVRDIPLSNNILSSTDMDLFKYADDGTISAIGPDLFQCQRLLQNSCDALYRWCCQWRLTINCNRNKTEAIVIRMKGVTDDVVDNLPKLMCGTKTIEYVRKSKVLGLIIDDNLSFQSHASSVLKRCWYDWYRVSKNTNRMRGLNTHSLTLIFKSVVCSKILYASPVWLNKQYDSFKRLWSRYHEADRESVSPRKECGRVIPEHDAFAAPK